MKHTYAFRDEEYDSDDSAASAASGSRVRNRSSNIIKQDESESEDEYEDIISSDGDSSTASGDEDRNTANGSDEPHRLQHYQRLTSVSKLSRSEASLLLYALASFAFFLASVGRHPPKIILGASEDFVNEDGESFEAPLDDTYQVDDAYVYTDELLLEDTTSNYYEPSYTGLDGRRYSRYAICSARAPSMSQSNFDDFYFDDNYSSMANFASSGSSFFQRLRAPHYGYALSLGILGTVFGLGMLAWKRCSRGGANRGEAEEWDREESSRNHNLQTLGAEEDNAYNNNGIYVNPTSGTGSLGTGEEATNNVYRGRGYSTAPQAPKPEQRASHLLRNLQTFGNDDDSNSNRTGRIYAEDSDASHSRSHNRRYDHANEPAGGAQVQTLGEGDPNHQLYVANPSAHSAASSHHGKTNGSHHGTKNGSLSSSATRSTTGATTNTKFNTPGGATASGTPTSQYTILARIRAHWYSLTQQDKRILLIHAIVFVWTIIGWIFFTFGGDDAFNHTGNGYFALTAMVCFSIANMGVTTDMLVEAACYTEAAIYGLTLCAVIVIMELTVGFGVGQKSWRFFRDHKTICNYGLVVATLSILLGLVTFGFHVRKSIRDFMQGPLPGQPLPQTPRGTPQPPTSTKTLHLEIRFWIISIMLALWIILACLTTFVGPFLMTGNGYFAVWASTFFSGLAFMNVQKEILKVIKEFEEAQKQQQLQVQQKNAPNP